MSEELAAAPLATLVAYDDFEAGLAVMREDDCASWKAIMALQAKADLYFFMRCVLSTGSSHNAFPDGRRYICCEHSYELARAEQFDHDGVMTMAARAHGKSTTKTFALPLWRYLSYPESCSCIWSVTRSLAKAHLRAIKTEIEINRLLHELWPDLFWKKTPGAARSWSLDEGLAMPHVPSSRLDNTFEAWGMVDQSFPTGKHFDAMYFDDVVDARCVTSPEMIQASRVTHDMAGGVEMPGACMRTYCGTPYDDNDTGVQLVREGIVRLRARPAVDTRIIENSVQRELGGKPVFMTEEALLERKRKMGEAYYSQMLLDPAKGRAGTLDAEKLRFYQDPPARVRTGMNVYLCCDPNGGFTPSHNDPMALTVWGLGGDRNIYLLDAWMGHLTPGERHEMLIRKQAEWSALEVRIEEMTMGSDSFWLKETQERFNHRFEVHSIRVQTMRAGSGKSGQYTRIQRLSEAWQPLLDERRLYVPASLTIEANGEKIDMSRAFAEELRRFPFGKSDHLISAGALLFAQHGGKRAANELIWPANRLYHQGSFLPHRQSSRPNHWMAVG